MAWENTPSTSQRLLADDAIMYITPSLQKMTVKKTQEYVKLLEKSEADWLMEFQPDKCFVIRITRKKMVHRFPYIFHGHTLA